MKPPLKRLFSKAEIICLLSALGSASHKNGTNGELIFQTVCHHGDSYKLYYYPQSRQFHCYTGCSAGFDAYELVMRSLACSFSQSVQYINGLFSAQQRAQQGFLPTCTQDWSLFERYRATQAAAQSFTPVLYPPALLDFYTKVYPIEWLQEGITPQAMDKFNIRFDIAHNKIIIPQYSPQGELIGIRGRALNSHEVAEGKKYMPVTIEGTTLRHPTAYSLYGLYQNQRAIRRFQKIMIFEAEKSVIKCDGFYGSNNFTAAVCGSSISQYQRSLILRLGVKEVFLAFDKEYHTPFTPQSDFYAEKILSLAAKFAPYVTTYVLWDTQGLLQYKDSPADRGQATLEQLMQSKFEVTTLEDECKQNKKVSATPN